MNSKINLFKLTLLFTFVTKIDLYPVEVYSINLITFIPGQNGNDEAGFSVACNKNGTIFAEGEPGFHLGSGRVRIFQYITGTNSYSGIGEIDGQNRGDAAGSSVALSADGIILAEGEAGYNFNGGRVRIFQYITGTNSWSGIGEIDGQNQGDSAGTTVALSADGTILAEGEPNFGTFSEGRVRIFQHNTGTNSWPILGTPIEGQNNALIGQNVSLNKNKKGDIFVAIAIAPKGSLDTPIYKYNSSNDSWESYYQEGALFINTDGQAIALNQTDDLICCIGYPAGNTGIGGAIEQSITPMNGRLPIAISINPLAVVPYNNGYAYDYQVKSFGFSVALNDNGNIFVAGAPNTTLTNPGFHNGDIGLLFAKINNDYIYKVLPPDDSLGNFDDQFGYSVALSRDGKILIVGAPAVGNTSHNPGAVYIFSIEAQNKGVVQKHAAPAYDASQALNTNTFINSLKILQPQRSITSLLNH